MGQEEAAAGDVQPAINISAETNSIGLKLIDESQSKSKESSFKKGLTLIKKEH